MGGRLRLAIASMVLGCLAISCGQPQPPAAKQDFAASNPSPTQVNSSPAPTNSASKTAPTPQADSSNTQPIAPTQPEAAKQPEVGTIKSMTSGDLMCYVKLVDEKDVEQTVGADPRLCNNKKFFLNRKVRLSYEVLPVSDCQSAEPCGKTRQQSLITKVEIVKGNRPETSSNSDRSSSKSQTFTNGEWTITVGNIKSTLEENKRSQDFTYRGCDAKGNCLELTGGVPGCRGEACFIKWRNGNYSYVVSSLFEDSGRISSVSLVVWQIDEPILKAANFKEISQ